MRVSVCVCVCVSITFLLHECVLTVVCCCLMPSHDSVTRDDLCASDEQSPYISYQQESASACSLRVPVLLRNAGESGGQTHTEAPSPDEDRGGNAGGIDENLNLSTRFFFFVFFFL